MTMDDSKPEKPVESKKKNKKKSNGSKTDQDENSPKGKANKNLPKKRVKKVKEKDTDAEISPKLDGSSDVFAFHEIANNKEASALIYDLIKCFTCNSRLPQKELDVLNKTLYEKTVSVFLVILNNCVEKIFNKILKGGFLERTKIVKKDASCQTEVSYEDQEFLASTE